MTIEDPYRTIIESADDPIFICDGDGRYVYGNAKAAANFGLTQEQFIGRTVDELFAPDVAAVFRTSVRHVIDSGETMKSEDHIFIGGVELWSSTVMQPLRDAGGHITAVQGIVRDITSRKQAEQALSRSEERLRQVIRVSKIGIYDLDFTTQTVYWSPEQRIIWGWGPDEPIHWNEFLNHVHPDDRERVFKAIERVQNSADGVFEIEHRIVRSSGEVRWVVNRGRNTFEGQRPDRRQLRAVGAVRDVTDEKAALEERDQLQAQLLQAQKLESIGRLAGGIAHDFNNILNVIIGCAELAASETDPSAVSGYLDEILKAATRSADVTRQLLGFARRQTVMPRVVDLNEFVSGSLKMLWRLIGENVVLSWHPGVGVWPVRIDPGQVDQILVNLMANARDAVGDAGTVIIRTENISRPDGDFVGVSVVDDGKGMDAETQQHLFEPFYTTKTAGRGTGLGMASVDGIVRQNGGTVTVTSDVGRGTAVNILLPRAREKAETKVITGQPVPKGGTETVLVVEDEPALLRLTLRTLGALGYRVLTATTPDEAIAIATSGREPVHLLVTDVVLPGMNGRHLADRLTARNSNLKCLFVSGYPDGAIGSGGVIAENVHFLQKPFTPTALAEKVREVLER